MLKHEAKRTPKEYTATEIHALLEHAVTPMRAFTMSNITNPLQELTITGLAIATSITNFILKYYPMFNLSAFILQGIADNVAKIAGDAITKDPAAQQFFKDVSDGKFDGREPTFGGGRRNLFATEQERKELFGS